MVNCATSGLEPYVPSETVPWDAARIQHLYRRIGFGANLRQIDEAITQGASVTINRLLDEAANQPLPPAPEWADYDHEQIVATGQDSFELYVEHMKAFLEEIYDSGIRERFVLFWHNHFVTKYEAYNCPSYLYQYFKLLREKSFGNFKSFVKDVSLTPAMLMFLNGFQNTKESPNENYARELFELFTLGENNGYTQEDIVEASRALTGYNGWTSYCGEVQYVDWGRDDGEKTIFGRTGNWSMETLIDVLFEERAELIARFICGKLYAAFVNPSVNEAIVNELAAVFIDADWDLLPVYKRLFTSQNFFDDANVGVLIKSPLDTALSFRKQGDFGDFENRPNWEFWGTANMGQYLGEPPDVFGWKGDRAWIDSNRLTLRWEMIGGYAWAVHNENDTTLVNWAKDLTGESREPEIIARAVVDFLIPRGLLTEEDYVLATDVLKYNVPSNYYEDGSWSLDWPSASWQIVVLLQHIGRLPEFQLT